MCVFLTSFNSGAMNHSNSTVFGIENHRENILLDTNFMFWTKSRFTVFFTIGAATTLKIPMTLSIKVYPCSSLFSTSLGSTLLSDPWFNIAEKIKEFLSFLI